MNTLELAVAEVVVVTVRVDEFAVVGADMFLHLAGGAGGTKLTNVYLDKQFATTSTVRNWATVLKLHALITASAKV